MVAQDHGGYPPLVKFKKRPYRIFFLCEWYAEIRTLPNVRYFFALNEEKQKYIQDLVGPGRVSIQTMGLDTELFRPIGKRVARSKLGLDNDKKYILYVGRLVREKGVQYLLLALPEILQSCPDAILLVAGDGPYREKLKRMALSLNLEKHITFLRWVKTTRLPLLYNAADVVVAPHLPEESIGTIKSDSIFSISQLEAVACGTPVVVTNTKIGDELKPLTLFGSNCGLRIPPYDPRAITEAILDILQRAIPLTVPTEEIRNSYDWKAIASKTLDIYEMILTRRFRQFPP
jgi:glycosyltransferase involved in cell wall biosynthesis